MDISGGRGHLLSVDSVAFYSVSTGDFSTRWIIAFLEKHTGHPNYLVYYLFQLYQKVSE